MKLPATPSPCCVRRDLVFALAGTTLVALLGSGCSVSNFAAIGDLPGLADSDGEIVTVQSLSRVNGFRSSNQRDPLAPGRAASRAALAHARAMAASGLMRHNIRAGDDFLTRMKKADVALPAAENIASGFDEINETLLAWEVSAGHRSNLLDPRFRGFGVAVATNPRSQGRPFWAMVLSG